MDEETPTKEKNEMTMTDKPPVEDAAPPVDVETRPVEPSQVPAVVDPALAGRNAAIEHAADAALAMPGMPGRDEFLTIAMTAKMLSLSGAAPKAVQNNPYVAFHVAMVGRDLGISPSAAIELIDVIEANGKYQLSLSPQLLNGQVRRLGLGSILKKSVDMGGCVAVAVGPGGIDRRCRLTWRENVHAQDCDCDILGESEFTWEDARMATLVSPNCEPGNHVLDKTSSTGRKYCGCNQGYITYWKRMSWWRASGFAADDYFPEAGLGLYTAEELGALVDAEGRAIDPMNVELPSGYEEQRKAVAPGESGEPTADTADLWRLQVRIRALPEEETEDLRVKWDQMAKLKGTPARVLSSSQYRLAESIVKGLEKKARGRVGYDVAEAVMAVDRSVAEKLLVLLVRFPCAGPPEGPGAPDGAATTDPRRDAAGPGDGDEATGSGDSGEFAQAASDAEAAAGPVVTDAAIAEVKAMKPAEVKAACESRGLDLEGDIAKLRQRLTLAILKERVGSIEGKP